MTSMPRTFGPPALLPVKTDPATISLRKRKTFDHASGAATAASDSSMPPITPARTATHAGELMRTAMDLTPTDKFTPFFASVITKLALANAPVAGQQPVMRTGTRQAHGGDIRTADGSSGTRLPDGSNAIGEQVPIIPTPTVNRFFSDRISRQEMLGLRKPPPPVPVLPAKTAALEKKAVLAFIRCSPDKGAAIQKLCQRF